MAYAFQLRPHPNIRYEDALLKLSKAELECLLSACGRSSPVQTVYLGNIPFLMIDDESLSEQDLAFLCRHSGLYMLARMTDGLLLPLESGAPPYLPPDFPQVLKYKGKTNVEFTRLMLNCARAASGFARAKGPLTVLDPMCGKGTTLFTALCQGDNAVGIDIDGKDLKEAEDYTRRYLQLHLLKHKAAMSSLTLPQGKSAPSVSFTLAASQECWQKGDTRSLQFITGDARDAARLVKRESAHLIVCDLPYGIQHAPQDGKKTDGFASLLQKLLPALLPTLKSGGAAAFSFNTYTLKKKTLTDLLTQAGFTPLLLPPYHDFEHWVEQAVERDLLIAVKP